MPWFPELFSASVLDRIRRDAADARAAEPVPYFDGVRSGEIDALVGSFAGEPEHHHRAPLVEPDQDLREPDVVGDPQAGAAGAVEAAYSATAPVSEVPKTATYTHACAESNGFLTLLSDGERLTGEYALGSEAGELLQQATLAIRAHVPLEVLDDTILPFPRFSGIYDAAVTMLRMEIMDRAQSGESTHKWQASRHEETR
jgi:hypothetical protein